MPRYRKGESSSTRAETYISQFEGEKTAQDETTDALLKRIEELEDELERRDMWETAHASGVRQEMDKQIAELQRKIREQQKTLEQYHNVASEAVNRYNNWMALLRDYMVAEENRRDQLHQRVKETVESMEAEFGKHGTPMSILAMQAIWQKQEADARNKPIELTEKVFAQGNITPQQGLDLLLANRDYYAKGEMSIEGIESLRWHTKNPYSICYGIMWELREYQHTFIETVSRLELDWIKKNIDKRIGSHTLLKDAVEHSWECIRGNHTQEQYAEQNYISIEKVKLYMRYFKKVEAAANEVGMLEA